MLKCSSLRPTAIAASPHDRRGHGRSSQPWNGNEMNTYADDLATLMDTLDLKNVGQDAGVMDTNDKDAFIAAAKTRQWDREQLVRTLA
jgi:pimeloyl-ACP methyl ester carboxylesterase